MKTSSSAAPPTGSNELARLRAGMRTFAGDDVVDAVIIGTGAGGAPILHSLAQAGLRVVALEAGPWFESPADDFAADEIDARKIYWTDERLSGGNTPEVLGGNTSGIGVGGSTLHWGAFTPRADERDLALRAHQGVGADWPLTLAGLRPYYESAECTLGVSGPAVYPWDPSRRYPCGPIPVNAPGELMLRGFGAIGVRASEAPIAALSRACHPGTYDDRRPCVGCGFCHQGCRFGAKATMDVTYLPSAVRAGAEIRPRCFATGFERDAAGRVTSVDYQRTDSDGNRTTHRQCTRNVFLCAGAIESARLLLHTGLANSSGLVGRNYMAHVATQVWGTFDQPVHMNRGFPATVISEDTLRPQDADFAGGYLVQSLGVVPVTWGQSVARSRALFGADLVRYLADYNYVAGIGINGDCLAADGNRVTLSDELDANGLPKPLVTFSYGKNEQAMRGHAVKLMTSAWQAAGARDIWVCDRSAHTLGTCRMGTSPDDSVVNADCRSHEIPNLYVCDSSIFPSALAANPGLTIMAVALRAAERFLKANVA